jgi:hypothetical protein
MCSHPVIQIKTSTDSNNVDHGNGATLPVATYLRPLDVILGTDRIPPVAKEAVLAAVKTRGLDDDDGLDAARLLQNAAWGRSLVQSVLPKRMQACCRFVPTR